MSDVSIPNEPQRPAPLTPQEVVEWLDFELTALLSRRAEIIDNLKLMVAAHPTIENDIEQGLAADNLNLARSLSSAAEHARIGQKAPFLEGGRAVDGWFKRFAAPLDEAVAPLTRAMLAYADAKERRERAAAQAEARKAAEEAARKAREAEEAAKAGVFSDDALDAAEAAERARQEAREAEQQAKGKPADFTRARGDFGAVASVRQSWSWEITDVSKVPRKFMTVDPAKIKDAAKDRDASGKPTAVIPGIRWVANRTIGVR
jgi:hypothetical protein